MSESSSLSSPPSSEDEAVKANIKKPTGLDRYFKPTPKSQAMKESSSPPPPKRAPSPPHEYGFQDRPDIAFIVMFRSRFSPALPKSLPHYGPQDIERGISEPIPSDGIERLLCALLGLVLNRKKDIEKGHYSKALEEAIQTHAGQWPPSFQGASLLRSGGSFNSMTPEQRLSFLKTLTLWALSSSDAVSAIIKDSYKQARHEDDKNQPLSVQSWGRDGYKRRYWLIEGQEDTHFRLYRENSGINAKTNTWRSVAGTIEEIKEIADKLDEENTPHARTLRDRIRAAIPRFEAGEDKRKRRDYRQARKAAFAKPEHGYSMYEGRTRGKRMRYTFSDDDDDDDDDEETSDVVSNRRSDRQSGISTPAENQTSITASGRHVRSKYASNYGDSIMVDSSGRGHEINGLNGDGVNRSLGRSTRQSRNSGLREEQGHQKEYDSDEEMEDEAETPESGHPWDKSDGEDDANEFEGDDEQEDEEEDINEADLEDEEMSELRSLIVRLPYRTPPSPDDQHPHGPMRENGLPQPMLSAPPVRPENDVHHSMNGKHASNGAFPVKPPTAFEQLQSPLTVPPSIVPMQMQETL